MSDNTLKHPSPEVKEKMRGYAGTRAVYRQMGFLAPVIIREIKWIEQRQTIFAATLERIDGILLTCLDFGNLPSAFDVSAGWEYLHVEPDHWALFGYGCSWKVSLNEKACDALVKFFRKNSGLELKNEHLFRQANGLLCKYGIL